MQKPPWAVTGQPWKKCILMKTGSGLQTAKMLTASQKNVSVIKYTFYQDDNTCSITAVNNNRPEQAETQYRGEGDPKRQFGL